MAVRIGVAASRDTPHLDEDWPRLREALQDIGIVAAVGVWSDPAVEWGRFDAVVVLGVWDYIRRHADFLDWARRTASRTRIVNPFPVLQWNTDKRYLADLAGAGVPIVPTEWIKRHEPWQPPAGDFVVKPAVSNGGFETARYDKDDIEGADAHIRRLLAAGAVVMVQPYQAAVDADGERALVYLDGRYSHATKKHPLLRPGEGVVDRLWQRHRIEACEPSDAESAVVQAAIDAVVDRFGPVAYARVDVVTGHDGGSLVLEVELIEPSLALWSAPAAPGRLARAIAHAAVG